jgi:hypothetical protein
VSECGATSSTSAARSESATIILSAYPVINSLPADYLTPPSDTRQ